MNLLKVIVTGLLLSSLVACKTTGDVSETPTESKKATASTEKAVPAAVEKAPRANAEKAPRGKRVIDGSDAAAGSKFSKLKLGMARREIRDTIGSPTDTRSYVTAKAWLPFYFGPDTSRIEYLYKGEGRLTIGGNGRLIGIVVDTNEDGYR